MNYRTDILEKIRADQHGSIFSEIVMAAAGELTEKSRNEVRPHLNALLEERIIRKVSPSIDRYVETNEGEEDMEDIYFSLNSPKRRMFYPSRRNSTTWKKLVKPQSPLIENISQAHEECELKFPKLTSEAAEKIVEYAKSIGIEASGRYVRVF